MQSFICTVLMKHKTGSVILNRNNKRVTYFWTSFEKQLNTNTDSVWWFFYVQVADEND